MVRPDTILQSLKEVIESSNRLPRSTSYATFGLDAEGGQSNVRPPIVEITTVDVIRNISHNTDFVGYATDSNGNHIGYIYWSLFEMPVQIDIWTAEGDNYYPDLIGRECRTALYRYDDAQYGAQLPDPDSTGDLVEVDRFVLDDGGPEDDLSMTPALRRFRQNAEVWFHEEINTAEEYGSENFIANVVAPGDGDMTSGTDVDIIFDATPNSESTADNF